MEAAPARAFQQATGKVIKKGLVRLSASTARPILRFLAVSEQSMGVTALVPLVLAIDQIPKLKKEFKEVQR